MEIDTIYKSKRKKNENIWAHTFNRSCIINDPIIYVYKFIHEFLKFQIYSIELF